GTGPSGLVSRMVDAAPSAWAGAAPAGRGWALRLRPCGARDALAVAIAFAKWHARLHEPSARPCPRELEQTETRNRLFCPTRALSRGHALRSAGVPPSDARLPSAAHT